MQQIIVGEIYFISINDLIKYENSIIRENPDLEFNNIIGIKNLKDEGFDDIYFSLIVTVKNES